MEYRQQAIATCSAGRYARLQVTGVRAVVLYELRIVASQIGIAPLPSTSRVTFADLHCSPDRHTESSYLTIREKVSQASSSTSSTGTWRSSLVGVGGLERPLPGGLLDAFERSHLRPPPDASTGIEPAKVAPARDVNTSRHISTSPPARQVRRHVRVVAGRRPSRERRCEPSGRTASPARSPFPSVARR